MTRLLGAGLLAVALSLGPTGCDRCAGVLACTGSPRISLDGSMIVHSTGAAVSGVSLAFVRTGGVALASDSITASTDGQGQFQLASDATSEGEVSGDLVVVPPAPWHAYRVSGLTFPTSSVRGEAQIVGRLVVDPFVAPVLELHRRGDGQLLSYATVIIVVTGGVPVSPDSGSATADTSARAWFEVGAAAPGTVIATVTVRSSLLSRAYTDSGLTFQARYIDSVPQLEAVLNFGPALRYQGAILVADSANTPVVGATVEFQRTGGILVTPSLMTTVTNDAGRFAFNLSSTDSGAVVGDLTIHPPAPLRDTTVIGISLATFEGDTQRLAGEWWLAPAP